MGFWSPRIAGVSRSLLWKMSVDRSSFLIELVDLVRGGYGEGREGKEGGFNFLRLTRLMSLLTNRIFFYIMLSIVGIFFISLLSNYF